MAMRSSRKPECISAEMDRACARAMRSAGQSAGLISAQYSPMARLSQIRWPLCSSTGTRPAGISALMAGVFDSAMGMTTSSTSSPARRTASQPRSDQEE